MILTDTMIRMMALVEPTDVPEPVPCPTSRGLSSCGYDLSFDAWSVRVSKAIAFPGADPDVPALVRSAESLSVLLNRGARSFEARSPVHLDNGTPYVALYPGEFALCAVNERIKLPRNIMARIFPKSTLARLGLRLEQTIAEPGWEGRLTLEMCNQSQSLVYLLHGMGITQLTFEQLTGDVELSYSDKNGKYHGDAGVQYAKMHNPVKTRR